MRADEIFEGYGGRDASRAYWNAFNKLRAAWRDVFDEDLQRIGSRGMEVYENALLFIKDRLAQDSAAERILRDALDIVPADDIGDALLRFDLDQFAPNEVKQAIRDEVDRHRDGDNTRLPLRPLLRKVLDDLFAGGRTRRPNVGPNRHWPRLLQYLRELEYETDWSPDGRGLRMANAGGRGPVAQFPKDPGRLVLVIEPDQLWPRRRTP